jgi:hypothetical protein
MDVYVHVFLSIIFKLISVLIKKTCIKKKKIEKRSLITEHYGKNSNNSDNYPNNGRML